MPRKWIMNVMKWMEWKLTVGGTLGIEQWKCVCDERRKRLSWLENPIKSNMYIQSDIQAGFLLLFSHVFFDIHRLKILNTSPLCETRQQQQQTTTRDEKNNHNQMCVLLIVPGRKYCVYTHSTLRNLFVQPAFLRCSLIH